MLWVFHNHQVVEFYAWPKIPYLTSQNEDSFQKSIPQVTNLIDILAQYYYINRAEIKDRDLHIEMYINFLFGKVDERHLKSSS